MGVFRRSITLEAPSWLLKSLENSSGEFDEHSRYKLLEKIKLKESVVAAFDKSRGTGYAAKHYDELAEMRKLLRDADAAHARGYSLKQKARR